MTVRYSRNLKIQKAHFFVGLATSLLITMTFAFEGFNFWVWQANAVSNLLSFAGVPHRLFISDSWAGGPTFAMIVNPHNVSLATVAIAGAITALVILFVNLFRKIPTPVKTVALVVSIVTTLTLLWQAVIAPIPPYNMHWVTLDWSCSGIISLCLITLIFTPLLFTIKGPLWVKVFWLFITIAFAVVWNLLRMSLVTATLYYFGGSVFLVSHYLAGAFIDFVYIVAFYSLALFHLSKFETDGGMSHGF